MGNQKAAANGGAFRPVFNRKLRPHILPKGSLKVELPAFFNGTLWNPHVTFRVKKYKKEEESLVAFFSLCRMEVLRLVVRFVNPPEENLLEIFQSAFHVGDFLEGTIQQLSDVLGEVFQLPGSHHSGT